MRGPECNILAVHQHVLAGVGRARMRESHPSERNTPTYEPAHEPVQKYQHSLVREAPSRLLVDAVGDAKHGIAGLKIHLGMNLVQKQTECTEHALCSSVEIGARQNCLADQGEAANLHGAAIQPEKFVV